MLECNDPKIGYNASTGVYEDMFAAGIIDPSKVPSLSHVCATGYHCQEPSQQPRSVFIQA